MITSFLDLDYIHSKNDVDMYLCTLPDPNPDTDDRFLPCGLTRIHFNKYHQPVEIDVIFNSLFMKLCDGESYQRRDFVFTVLFLLGLIDSTFDYENIIVNIKDNWGSFSGAFSMLDDTCWSVEE